MKYTVAEAVNHQLGQGGYDIVTNATVNSDTYIAITILVGTEVIADNTASGTVTATAVVPVGCTIYGRWSSVTLGANDTAIVYRG